MENMLPLETQQVANCKYIRSRSKYTHTSLSHFRGCWHKDKNVRLLVLIGYLQINLKISVVFYKNQSCAKNQIYK